MTQETVAVFGHATFRRPFDPKITAGLGDAITGRASPLAAPPLETVSTGDSRPPVRPTAPKPPLTLPVGDLSGPRPTLQGSGELGDPRVVTLDGDLAAKLSGSHPPLLTHVVITWVPDGATAPTIELHRIRQTGKSDHPGNPTWVVELETPSGAPHFELPPGATPANALCFLFPWLSFCKKN